MAAVPTRSEGPTPPSTLVVGVLGGIASGKSLVARLLAGPNGRVISADALAHEVLASEEVRAKLRERYGDAVFDSEGELDRPALAGHVFENSARRAELESWIHPRVRARIRAGLDEARAAGIECVVLDVPLLLENEAEHGLASLCDRLVFVEVPLEERDRRAARDRGWQPGEVARRERAQLPLARKRERADHIVVNRGSPAELEAAVAAIRRALGLH